MGNRQCGAWRPAIENSVRVLEESAQENLAEDIVRPTISLKKIQYEPFKRRVPFHNTYSDYFRENLHMFDVPDFIVELTQHVPPKGLQLFRRYGLSITSKGRWKDLPWVSERAPEGRESSHPDAVAFEGDGSMLFSEDKVEEDVLAQERAWASLLAKVYDIDPLGCPCGTTLNVIAAIENPDEIPAVLTSFHRQCPSRVWPLLSLHLPIRRILEKPRRLI